MLPVIALVGRPNVGKSTLFNFLTRSRDALVADFPGLTRDRQYGYGKIGDSSYLLVDTGGLTDENDGIEGLVAQQALLAVAEADAVLLLVDGRGGLTAADETIAEQLRRSGKSLYLVVNKTEHLEPVSAAADFYALGMPHLYTISASQGHRVKTLINNVLQDLSVADEIAGRSAEPAVENHKTIRLAIVGRPNVGKSTLVNRFLGEERVLAFDQPGTTRDSVMIPFDKDGQHYTLIDTAGVRRRSRVNEAIEKFSVIKTLQAIQQAHVVLMMLDARQGIAEQDATLLGLILDSGRALVLAVNKWDHLTPDVRDSIRRDLNRKLSFLDFADRHFISAIHGTGIVDVLRSVDQAYASATRELSTPQLTRILQDAMVEHQPPLVQGRSIKLRYAHQGGQNPPVIVIHGNRVAHVPQTYKRYLANKYRKILRLRGTPVRIELKSSDNPYDSDKPRQRRQGQVRRRT